MDSDVILAPLMDMVDNWYEGWGRGPTRASMRAAAAHIRALPQDHPAVTASPRPDGGVQLAWTQCGVEEKRDF